MPATSHSVVIADRDPAQRAVMAGVLGTAGEFEVVGEAGDGPTTMELLHRLAPAVALVEADLERLGGPEIAREAQRHGLSTRVVVVAGNGSVEPLARGMAFGAAGGLSKAASADRLTETVAAAGRGETRLPAELEDVFLQRLRDQWLDDRPKLPPRQREVLALVAEGLSGPKIAEVLELRPATVKSHLERLYANLGVTDRAAAVAVAMRTGLLS